MVINKNASKIYKFCVLQVVFSSLKLVGTVFVSLSYESIISSHVIAQSSIILAKLFPFSQLNVAEF